MAKNIKGEIIADPSLKGGFYRTRTFDKTGATSGLPIQWVHLRKEGLTADLTGVDGLEKEIEVDVFQRCGF